LPDVDATERWPGRVLGSSVSATRDGEAGATRGVHMSKLGKILKGAVGTVALLGVAGAGYLAISPPALLKVATNYSAKIVCSNVFIAGRDAEEVLALDVQAPGHPVLKQISMRVDEDRQRIETRVFGFFAPAVSQYRPGLGCTNLHEAELTAVEMADPAAPGSGIWPEGNEVADVSPAVQAVLEDAALTGQGARAVLVLHQGRIIGEAYGAGFDAETPLLGWSMTKTVTAGLIGTLIQSGDMALTDLGATSYPAWAQDDRADVTVADLLGMESGLQWNESYGDVSDVTKMLYLNDDMAGFTAKQPAEAAIGRTFNYSSGTSTMLSRIWQDQVGADSLAYPRKALFDPLGMSSAILETDAADTFVGSSYMYASARDWARYGQFLLQKGAWDGAQLVPEGFVDWMFEPTAASGGTYAKGHLWLEAPGEQPPFEDAVWLYGHDGQTIGIFPSRDLVILRMGLTPSKTGYSELPLVKAVIAALED